MGTFQYSQHIWHYGDPNSFFLIKIVALIDLFTFHTYAATALWFALLGFFGSWSFYLAIYKKYGTNRYLAWSILFVPSVVFWGSGLLKDTMSMAAIGWLTWSLIHLIDFKERRLIYWSVAIMSGWLLYSIKPYILVCYVPLVFVWIYWRQIIAIRSIILKVAIAPILMMFFLGVGYVALFQITESSATYTIDNIPRLAAITSYDIRYGWGHVPVVMGGMILVCLTGHGKV